MSSTDADAAGTTAEPTLAAPAASSSSSSEVFPEGYPGFGFEVLPPEGVYSSRDEAYRAINGAAAEHGYAFKTTRSFQTPTGLTTAMYSCDRAGRGGDPNRVLQRQRAASRRIGCRFSVYVKERRDGMWEVRHRTGEQFSVHNHAPSTNVFAHRAHRALDADMKDTIDVLVAMDMKMRQIVTFLQLKYRKQVQGRDVQNYIASARRQRQADGGGGEGGGGDGANGGNDRGQADSEQQLLQKKRRITC